MAKTDTFQQILERKIEKKQANVMEFYGIDPYGFAQIIGVVSSQKLSVNPRFPSGKFPYPKKSSSKVARPTAHILSEIQFKAFQFFNRFTLLHDSFSQTELKNCFRSLARKLHPDKGGSAPLYIELKTNYEILKKLFN